jgi:lysophospholipase L1-like esterase
LLVALGIAEAVVRIFHLAPQIAFIEAGRFRLSANPKIGYEPHPLHYQGKELKLFDYRGASNSLGYRDTDHPIEKPAGVYRILLIGDSIGSGLLIDRFEDIFPQVIVETLRSAGQSAEVINLSVSGYNTQQEVETLVERGLAYDSDLVLLQYCLNDRRLENGGILSTLLRQELEEKGIPSVRLHPILLRSELVRLIRFRLEPYRGRSVADQAALQQSVSQDTVVPSLERLAFLSRDHGFEVLAVIFPTFQSFAPYRDIAEHRWIASQLDRLGIPKLDLLEEMARCSGGDVTRIAYDTLHPNEAGHRCAGIAIAREIMAMRAGTAG